MLAASPTVMHFGAEIALARDQIDVSVVKTRRRALTERGGKLELG